MRYLIITYDDYFNIPYVKYYEEHLRKNGHIYDIVLWNRSGQKAKVPNAYIYYGKDHHSRLSKIIPFLGWRRFVLRLLKRQSYDRLILLTTVPAVLLADRLLSVYRKRFWLDIRDFTYENVPFYKRLVADLVYAAAAVSISSPAFRCFLPETDNIFLTHNISNQNALEEHCTLNPDCLPIRIGFVGGIQFKTQNQILLRQFANNPAYQLDYVGKVHPACDLQSFCQENHIQNAAFYPAFMNDEKPRIYKSVDLINCVYGSGSEIVQLALPNKLYDCILYKKPMLVSKGNFLARVVQQYHLGLAVDIEKDSVVQMTDDYLRNFDYEAFEQGCETFLQVVLQDQAKFEDALDFFCSGS